jgi:hypothetical protein
MQRGMSGPEVGVADRWLDSFGRDRRSKTVFPEVYHSSIKKNERPAKDFSERPDVQVRKTSINKPDVQYLALHDSDVRQ